MFTFGKPSEVKSASRSNFQTGDKPARGKLKRLRGGRRAEYRDALTQAQLKNQRFRLAGKGEISVQLHAAVYRLQAAADGAGIGLHRTRFFRQRRQRLLRVLLVGKNLAVGRGAVGIVHHGADIHTAACCRFLCAAFINCI
ncbi:protein of unknown function [Serratia sp. Tan611]|nr:protein of unknown function [Serratia sp. Tan611]